MVYVASRNDRYIEEAFLSASTVKQRDPALPITLFTDRPRHPLCAAGGPFDAVVAIEGVAGIASGWAAGQLNRLRCLGRSPYVRTLHLDTDTRLLTEELPWLFARLDQVDVAMVETAVDDSYSRRHFGRRMFNAGFVLYRRCAAVDAWLEAWAALSERYFRLAGAEPLPDVPAVAHVADAAVRRRLLGMDQVSLVELLHPGGNAFGLAVETLDYSWNHRGSKLAENNRVPVRVLHAMALKDLTHADILATAFAWRTAGRHADAARLLRYLAGRYPAGAERGDFRCDAPS